MLRKLFDLRVILTILLLLTIGIGAIVGLVYKTSFDQTITEKDMRIAELQSGIDQIGQLVPAYMVNSDVRMGKEIKETDLMPVEVPYAMATNLIGRMDELVGRHYKVDVTAGTVLSVDLVTHMELTDDLRLFDVVLDSVPVGIKEGDYVDVRIALPMGEDFIGIAHRRVYDVNNGVLKLAINEKDIHSYNSMLVDSMLFPGTTIYAIKYLEGGAQRPAQAYYPISTSILTIAEKDPNLLTAIQADMLTRRDALETTLGGVRISQVEIDRILERGRQNVSASIDAASREYQRRLERLEAERIAEERRNNR